MWRTNLRGVGAVDRGRQVRIERVADCMLHHLFQDDAAIGLYIPTNQSETRLLFLPPFRDRQPRPGQMVLHGKANHFWGKLLTNIAECEAP